MPTIVSHPGFFVKGFPNAFTLDKAELLAHAKVQASTYFSDTNHWRRIAIKYSSSTSTQAEYLMFDASETTPGTDFEVTTLADDLFNVEYLVIYDFDEGSLVIERDELTVGDFDIGVQNIPEGQSVFISGVEEVGNVLTLNYTYYDEDGDPEGATTFQWYVADNASGLNETAIPGETNQTYTPVIADSTKFLTCEVTVVAASGVNPGYPVKASYTGEILFILDNSEGLYDATWQANLGTGVPGNSNTALANYPDGSIIFAGSHFVFDGNPSYWITKLQPDGSYDAAYNAPRESISMGGFPYSVEIQSDGKAVIGGDFTTGFGVSRNRIFRLNADGTDDGTFGTNIGSGFDAQVDVVKVLSTGKIAVGGEFTTFNGVSSPGIACLNADGTLDPTFASNIGAGAGPGQVLTIDEQADGKLLIGGTVTNFNGNGVFTNMIRLNANGLEDVTFNSTVGVFNNDIEEILVQDDGKILVVGFFTTVGGASNGRIARLNSDGTTDTAFTTIMGTGFDGQINNVLRALDGVVFVTGNFNNLNGSSIPFGIYIFDESTGLPVSNFLANSNGGFGGISTFQRGTLVFHGPNNSLVVGGTNIQFYAGAALPTTSSLVKLD